MAKTVNQRRVKGAKDYRKMLKPKPKKATKKAKQGTLGQM
jgi:hypothetical protein